MNCHSLAKIRQNGLWSVLFGVTLLCCCIVIYYSFRAYDGKCRLPMGCSYFEHAALKFKNKACKSICKTKDCIEIANGVLNHMDLSADPCEDFFQFACGNFHEKYGPENNYSSFRLHGDSLNRIVRDIIETSKETQYPDSAAQKLKIVFDSCMDTESLERTDIQSMTYFLSQIGIKNWPNIDLNFTFSNPNVMEILGKLATFEEVIFLKFEDENKDSLYLDKTYKEGKNFSSEGLKTIVSDILKYAGMNEDNIEYAWKSFVEVENIVAEIKQNNSEATEKDDDFDYEAYQVHYCNATETRKDGICQMLEAVVNYGGLSTSYTTEKLNIFNRSMVYIQGISHFLQHFNHRALAHYIALRVVLKNLKYMNIFYRNKLENLIDQYGSFFGSIYEKRFLKTVRWKYCIQFIKRHLELPLGFLYVAEMFSPEAIVEISDMVKKYQKVIGEFIRAQDSISENTKNKLLKEIGNIKHLITHVIKSIENGTITDVKYRKMDRKADQKRFRNIYSWDYVAKKIEKEKSYIIDVLAWYQNRTKIDESYRKFHPLKNEFLYNVIYHKNRHFTGTHLDNSFEKKVEDYDFNEVLLSVNAVNMIGIHLMFGVLLPPFYKHEHPKLFNTAQLGQVVAHEIGHSVYEVLGSNMYDNETRLYIEAILRCQNAQYSNFELKRIGEKLNANLTENDDFADNVAIQVSERVVSLLFRDKKERNFMLPGADFSSEELFYILYAQPWCAVRSIEMDNYLHKYDEHSPSEFRVYAPFQNSKKFSKVFNCPATSYMNPQKKCPVFY